MRKASFLDGHPNTMKISKLSTPVFKEKGLLQSLFVNTPPCPMQKNPLKIIMILFITLLKLNAYLLFQGLILNNQGKINLLMKYLLENQL
jgi:hypothetical protein